MPRSEVRKRRTNENDPEANNTSLSSQEYIDKVKSIYITQDNNTTTFSAIAPTLILVLLVSIYEFGIFNHISMGLLTFLITFFILGRINNNRYIQYIISILSGIGMFCLIDPRLRIE